MKSHKNHLPHIAQAKILMGRIQNLRVARFSAHGAYLSPINQGEDNEDIKYKERYAINAPEVLLPNKFVQKSLKINDILQVFVYTDSSDRPTATTLHPYAQCGDIAVLEVVGHSPFGCFLSLGIDKDILMPCSHSTRFLVHQKIVVKITLDKQMRLLARYDISPYLKTTHTIAPNTKVQALIFKQTRLGFSCVVNGAYTGLLYHTHIPKNMNLHIGTSLEAYTQGFRKDGKLNLTLFAPHSHTHKQTILDSMPLALDFESSPKLIFQKLHISKKCFKRVINELTREGKIIFDKDNAIFRRI